MKKLFLIPITLLLFACPSDDDNPPPTPSDDQIIGTWKFYKLFINNEEQPLDACENEETLIFNTNGVYTGIGYEEDIDNTCLIEYEASGTWENIGSANYLFISEGFSDTEELIFENNTFYVEYVDDFGTPSDTTDDVLIKEVYLKQ